MDEAAEIATSDDDDVTTEESPEITDEVTLAALDYLLDSGMTKGEIADAIYVSWRAIHRWQKREMLPKSRAQRRALIDLAATRKTEAARQAFAEAEAEALSADARADVDSDEVPA